MVDYLKELIIDTISVGETKFMVSTYYIRYENKNELCIFYSCPNH